ncbi:30S ribosomal protein S6 [Desulfobacter postgatei]|jgi:small subunit ribosomal protein S6|uniref:30S ribosomal protein S6 n=1 Tax=Desulfobacter postgatei TaxID=2293 RepID=UPI002A360524|nr:30S ribosomal protein S6 [Desulfobacter postgatei]MDX9962214.1 30S ribosomal protein S6 [Desulfobacter postgatei]
MRKYETVFIADPDMSDQAREELFEKVKNIIDKEGGILLNFDEWGVKKLSYEIKKKLRGYYVCLTYGGTGELVTELERNFRLSDLVMKFMTILITEYVTEESLKQDAEQFKEAAKQAALATPQEEDQEGADEEDDLDEDNADDQDDEEETESEPAEESKE